MLGRTNRPDSLAHRRCQHFLCPPPQSSSIMCKDYDSTGARIFYLCELPTLQFLGGTSQVHLIDMKFFYQPSIRQITMPSVVENLKKQNDLRPRRKMFSQYQLLRSKRIVCFQINQARNMCYAPRNNESNLVSAKPIIILCIHLSEKQNRPFRIILRK